MDVLPALARWPAAGDGRCGGRPGVETSLDAARTSACATLLPEMLLDDACPAALASRHCPVLRSPQCAPASAPAFPVPAWAEYRARPARRGAWPPRPGATPRQSARRVDASSTRAAA